ncbi:MAG TPA: ATP-binding protein [Gemmatimonadales bacterium]|nr:ATP-binding protein [Gemmatimonadales bacterium]
MRRPHQALPPRRPRRRSPALPGGGRIAIRAPTRLAHRPILRADEALAFLARASGTLGSSLDYETTLTTVARLMVPALADWCAVDLVEASGEVRRLAVAHADPARERWAWELGNRYPAPPDSPVGVPNVLRTGAPELFPEITEAMISRATLGAEHGALLRALDLRSYIGAPLTAHGRTLGVLTLVTTGESGRSYGAGDLALVMEVAARAAIAVDNARLHRAEHAARAAAEATLEALRASEHRFRSIFESGMLGIGFWDGERVTEANAAFLAMLGYTTEDVAAGALRRERLTPPEYRNADLRAREECRLHGSCTPYEKEFYRKDGSRIPVLAGGTLFESGAGVFFMLDISERRAAIEQLQAAQRMEAVGRLAGGVAHEINNALQGVVGFSRFALRALDPGHPVRADVEQIERSAFRAASITQQLLAYSRRQLLHPAPHDLNGVVSTFAPMLRQALGPELSLEIRPADEAAVVLADRGQIEQVLLNLTLNARDAMGSGGRLLIEVGRLQVPAASPGLETERMVTLTVSDDGHGMDSTMLSQIFDPFFTTKPPGQGTGLGLSVVQGIVQQSGGRVSVTSTPGAGASFRILLPEAGTGTASGEAAQSPATPGGSETILLVDDEEGVRLVAARFLADHGYDVIEAATPVEALQALTASLERGRPVELIISDIVMPAGGGEALSRAAAAWAERNGRPAIPILFMSGRSNDEIAGWTLETRAAFIQKPFNPDALARMARDVIDVERRARGR